MTRRAEQILASATLYSDGGRYKLVQLPKNAITLAAGIIAEAGLPFSAVIVDKDEVSLILLEDICQEFAARLHRSTISEINYRLITFDAVLEPDLVGFLAEITKQLARADIPILAFAAYSRDHIFVPEAEFDAAIAALNALTEAIVS